MTEPQSLEELRAALKSTFEAELYVQAIDELVDKLEFVRSGTIELTACEKALGSIFITRLMNQPVHQEEWENDCNDAVRGLASRQADHDRNNFLTW